MLMTNIGVNVITALALVFVLEGIFPFLSPQKYRRFVILIIKHNDLALRLMGLFLMLLGLVLIHLIHLG